MSITTFQLATTATDGTKLLSYVALPETANKTAPVAGIIIGL